MSLLREFMRGKKLDTQAVECMLLPASTHRLYVSTEEVRRGFELRVEKEVHRVVSDIDSVKASVSSLFEEIKTIFVGKMRNSELELRESLTHCVQNVDQYLKQTWQALVEEQRSQQYHSLKRFTESGSVDRNMDEMQEQRRVFERAENALRLIRNNQKQFQVAKIAESVDSFLRSEQALYDREKFRKLFGGFRDELVWKLEEMDLFKEGNIVRGPNMFGEKKGTGRNEKSYETPGFFSKKMDTRLKERMYEVDSLGNRDFSLMDESGDSAMTDEKPGIRNISSDPRRNPGIKQKWRKEDGKGAGESVAMSMNRKEMLEEREKRFRKVTGDPMWQSRDLGELQGGNEQADDNSSWKFLESIKRKIFGD